MELTCLLMVEVCYFLMKKSVKISAQGHTEGIGGDF